MELKRLNKIQNMNNIILYHQNVQSLTNKIDELSVILHNNHVGPHFVCFSEHHLKETELSKITHLLLGTVERIHWEEVFALKKKLSLSSYRFK